MDLLESLNKKFTETFAKKVAELNTNIYPAAKLDSGKYEAPVIVLGPGGGTAVKEKGQALAPPATVNVEMKEVDATELVYRIAIPRSEAEIADKNPAYFAYLFSKVLERALANYRATVGGPETLRFGSHYLKITMLNINDGADFIEMRLDGSWADV